MRIRDDIDGIIAVSNDADTYAIILEQVGNEFKVIIRLIPNSSFRNVQTYKALHSALYAYAHEIAKMEDENQ